MPVVQWKSVEYAEEFVNIHEPLCFRLIYPRTTVLQEDICHSLRVLRRTTRPTIVIESRSCLIELENISNGSIEGNKCILDNSLHTIDIESDPSPEDWVWCHINSIETLGSRKQNNNSSPGQKKEIPHNLRVLKDNIDRSSYARGPIPWNLWIPKDKYTRPTGSEHEAL